MTTFSSDASSTSSTSMKSIEATRPRTGNGKKKENYQKTRQIATEKNLSFMYDDFESGA